MTTIQEAVHEYQEEYGYPPLQHDIAQALGVSDAAISQRLARMERDGLLVRRQRKPRSRLVDRGLQVADSASRFLLKRCATALEQ